MRKTEETNDHTANAFFNAVALRITTTCLTSWLIWCMVADMQGIGRLLVCALLVALCASCSSMWTQNKPREEETKRKALPPLHLGAVHHVYPEQKFALLRIIGPMPSPGTTLISHPVDGSTSRIGNLVVAENSKPRNGMLVADIRSGTVVSGDRVFMYRDVAPPEQTETHITPHADTVEDSSFSPKPPPLQIRTTGTAQLTTDTDKPDANTAAPIPDPIPVNGPHSMPSPSSTPSTIPDYLKDIPDDINGWN